MHEIRSTIAGSWYPGTEREIRAFVEKWEMRIGGEKSAPAIYVGKTGATICGRIPIELALRAFPGKPPFVRLAYATSSDSDRDFLRFVCYTAAVGRVEWPREGKQVLDAEARAYLLRVARESMECAVKGIPYSRTPFPVPHSPITTKMGAFLPQVAPELGWDLETTLTYLSRKAGLSADVWHDGAKFETFQAEVFHE